MLKPTCRLPPELLAMVFSFCEKNEPWERPSGSSHWIKVAQVCHHWRQVALDCASLWANISLMVGVRWMREMLRRSKHAAISYDSLSSVSLRPRKKALLVKNMYRTRSMSLPVNDHGEIVDILSLPMPRLEYLYLEDGCHDPSPPMALNAPNLRHLHLQEYNQVAWTSSGLHHLVSLRIIFCLPVPSLDDVLDALQEMPLLECIELSHNCPPQTSTSHSPVELRKLMDCFLHGEWFDIVHLFDHLRPSSEVKLQLDLSMGDSTSAKGLKYYGPIIPLLTTHFLAMAEPLLPVLRLSDTGKEDLQFGLRRGEHHTDLQLAWYRRQDSCMPDHGPESQVWHSILQRAGRLKSIRVFGNAGSTLCNTLADLDAVTVPHGEIQHAACAPQLTSLIFDHVNFNDDAAARLLAWSERRKVLGCPTLSLNFMACWGVRRELRECGVENGLESDGSVVWDYTELEA
ncbi:hypothetical protein FA95DRAFT_1570642 [Auriscalpium vulgare]|uniref:Uncharacterized protein n=1 Tax=Auriscalpium vulgare TaxID=40419 RepID=A0ACB8S2Q6_9AGAM|nr:hypothetical protein FA95DRAFT_1570642 [Auriscalpium vulgare]